MSDRLPEGWTSVPLSHVTVGIPNTDPHGLPDQEFGYVDISSVNNHTFRIEPSEVKRVKGKNAPSRARRPIARGDVLFSNVRTYLKNIALVPDDLNAQVCSTGFTVLRSNGAVEPLYLLRWLLTDSFVDAVTPQQTGTHYPATSDRVVRAQHISVPPLAEQRRIVAKVEALLPEVNAARGRLARVPAILKRFRLAVLAAACSGRLTDDWRASREPNTTVKPVLKTGPAVAHPTDDFDLDVPESWCIASLDEATTLITSGSRAWKPYYSDNGYATFVMAQNIRPLRFDQTYKQGVSPPLNDPERKRTEVHINDLLITIVGANTGDVCRVHVPIQEHYVCQSVALARPLSGEWSEFLAIWFNSPEHGARQFKTWLYGEGRPHLSFEHLRQSAVALPSSEEQREIASRVGALFVLADTIEKLIVTVTSRGERLAQAILAKAFRGELVPTEAELAREEGREYEPASVLLERIRSERELYPGGTRKRPGDARRPVPTAEASAR